jgi:hypothetical protein
MERPMFIDDGDHSRYQLVPFEIGEVAQPRCASEVSGVKRVTAGATQGALFGDFDRKGGRPTGQDSSPCLDYFRFLHCVSEGQSHSRFDMVEG